MAAKVVYFGETYKRFYEVSCLIRCFLLDFVADVPKKLYLCGVL